MCYLYVLPGGVEAAEWRLIKGSEANPHGFGWSVGLREVYHTLDPEAAIAHFQAARRRKLYEPAIFHARYATGDSPHTLANCQPLVLDDGTLLAHNGGLFPVRGSESDTRVFTREFLPGWNLDDDMERLELGQIIAPNKMFILRPGKVPVLLGDKYGLWYPDGSWASNRDGDGGDHLAAGQCAACGTAVEGGEYASLCTGCQMAYDGRYAALQAAR
jgi:hypothetical protein